MPPSHLAAASRPHAGRPWRIGCAGWSIGSQHRHLFDEGASMLARYATRFDAVEINSSFYRPHQRATYARWADSVPDAFRFAVKLPRSITHEARLHRTGPLLDRFVGEVAGLGTKLGVVLVQLPPSLTYDARTAGTFFRMLAARVDGALACEPRHASWYGPQAERLWDRHRVARVAADPPRPERAAVPGLDGRALYWRWHGTPRVYFSDYDEARLQAMANQVIGTAIGDRPAWCIFDNTAHGHAVPNALRFQALLAAR